MNKNQTIHCVDLVRQIRDQNQNKSIDQIVKDAEIHSQNDSIWKKYYRESVTISKKVE